MSRFFISGGSGDPTLRIRDMGDASTHWKKHGRISSPDDMPTDRAEAKKECEQWLVLTPTGYGDGRGGLGGGGYIQIPPPEQHNTVHGD